MRINNMAPMLLGASLLLMGSSSIPALATEYPSPTHRYLGDTVRL